ncbi:endoribonuclease MazF [Calothrix sp. CCY 0018]|uniref:endoribonuclease MazF n=1 Tax=Calothrix sp. CCY 0018 TaxID=3103864 RepID=UPI0039C64581
MVTHSDSYIPSRGDIVYLDFDPTKGHEQRGYRPAVVISPYAYNKKSSLALFIPVTSNQKNYPFEVVLPDGLKTHGIVLVNQIKCLDWKARKAKFIECLPEDTIEEIQAKIEPLIF